MPRLLRPLLALALIGCAGKDGAAATRAADAESLQPAAASAPANGPTAPTDSAAALLAKADAGRILGNPEANVWLIIISDFQCPFCKRWHEESWEAIRKEYVDTGKIRVAYVNLPLEMHRNAWPAAHAAMCAGVQGKFWPVQDAIIRTQDAWSGLTDPHPAFETLAKEAGADVEQLRACVKSSAMRPIIQGDVNRANNAGAQSTPTFFVGGKPVIGAQPLAVFREALDAALAAKPAGK
jgi:protein-disulfide isomerase